MPAEIITIGDTRYERWPSGNVEVRHGGHVIAWIQHADFPAYVEANLSQHRELFAKWLENGRAAGRK